MNATPSLQALIFDVDGTLADTESAHLQAFNQAFAEVGNGWVWTKEEYTELLKVSGGKERIVQYWKQRQPDLVDIGRGMADVVAHIHEIKASFYEQAVQSGAVSLRPGALELIQSAHAAGLKMAIATTTSPVNIANLLRKALGDDWQSYFAVVQDASTAPQKKPHPQVYLQTLDLLGLPAAACLAFEDSANGLQSALAAGLQVIITYNSFTEKHNFDGALRVLPSLQGVTLNDLNAWR